MQDKIVCLVGPSGAGKTTIAKQLAEEGYNIILSYTTRAMRSQGEWGHTFIERPIFESESDKIQYIYDKDKIAFFDNYGDYYFATRDQYQGKGTSIYIIDPSGAEAVKRNVTDAEVIIIFIMVDLQLRKNYMMADRTRSSKSVVERLRTDYHVFAKSKCDYVVDANRPLNEVVENIKQIIGGMEYERQVYVK